MEREIKHTEIGDIPVDWKFQTFDETFRVLSNNTLSRENLNNRSGAIRNIHYGDILTKFPEVLDCNKEKIQYVNDLSMLSSSTQLLQDGDIVVADTAEDETVGKVTEVQNLGDSKLVAGLHTIPCRVKKGDFAPGWLGYYMNSDLFHNQILPYITGIKVSSISKGAISETLILVPPFDEQEKIVQTLNEVQLLMTAETKVVNKIKFVKNGCLSKMFPQKDDPVPEMRLPGFTAAWEQRKLSEFVDKAVDNRGKTPPLDENGTHPLIEVAALGGVHPNYSKVDKYLSDDSFENNLRAYIKKGDILFTTVGSIGLVSLMDSREEAAIAQNIVAFRAKENFIPEYLYALFSNEENQYKANRIVMGAVQPSIKVSQLVDVEYMLTRNVKEQKEIGSFFSNIDNLITLHQRKCDKYSNIKKGMMNDLLTGKIRLV